MMTFIVEGVGTVTNWKNLLFVSDDVISDIWYLSCSDRLTEWDRLTLFLSLVTWRSNSWASFCIFHGMFTLQNWQEYAQSSYLPEDTQISDEAWDTQWHYRIFWCQKVFFLQKRLQVKVDCSSGQVRREKIWLADVFPRHAPCFFQCMAGSGEQRSQWRYRYRYRYILCLLSIL